MKGNFHVRFLEGSGLATARFHSVDFFFCCLHPEAKKFFRMGMSCLGRKDWKGAVLNLTFARNFEPASALLGERLAEANQGLAAAKAAAPAKPGAPR